MYAKTDSWERCSGTQYRIICRIGGFCFSQLLGFVRVKIVWQDRTFARFVSFDTCALFYTQGPLAC